LGARLHCWQPSAGAHVVVADRDVAGAEAVTAEVKAIAGKEFAVAVSVDIRNRETIREALAKGDQNIWRVDILINTAAIFPASPDGVISDAQWALTLEVNVTANYLLTDEAAKPFKEQGLAGQCCADELGKCGCFEARQRGLRREQGGAEPSGSRAGGWPGAAGPGERHQSGDGGEGIDDVSAGSRDRFVE
jgi:NAD(P)-dependent dehydrogenase (short-subunit alcohol dehydrogenase family)